MGLLRQGLSENGHCYECLSETTIAAMQRPKAQAVSFICEPLDEDRRAASINGRRTHTTGFMSLAILITNSQTRAQHPDC